MYNEQADKNQLNVDIRANALFDRLMDELVDATKLCKGLKPVRIYLGMTEWATLAQWSLAQSHFDLKKYNESLSGCPFYRVSDANHLYIAWE